MRIPRRDFVRWCVGGAMVATLTGSRGAASVAPVNGSATVVPFCFCVIADCHCAEPLKQGKEGLGDGVAKFLRCIDAIQRLDEGERPDFVLLAGDVHPWALQGHEQKLTVPIYAVAGNHESSREKRKQLRQVFGRGFEREGQESDYYSFVHKGIRFIAMCDVGSGGDHVGHLSSELIAPPGQCEWLENQLAQPEPAILFAHIPPMRNGLDAGMCLGRNDSRWLNGLIEQTKPKALFFGHLHKPTEEYRIGDTRCFNVRSCCWNFGDAPVGFLHVRVADDTLTVREIETGR